MKLINCGVCGTMTSDWPPQDPMCPRCLCWAAKTLALLSRLSESYKPPTYREWNSAGT